MWDEGRMIEYLKKNLKNSRLQHSFRVMDTSIKLAEIYHCDCNKAKIAGLIHDCAKNINNDEMINIMKKSGYNTNDESFMIPQTLHGPVGALIAKNVMGIEDQEILNAIEYHTIGRKNMSILEKVIYIADYIEPLRNFQELESVREFVYSGDIDKALLMSFDNTIKYIIKKGQLLHKNTIEARNYILSNR